MKLTITRLSALLGIGLTSLLHSQGDAYTCTFSATVSGNPIASPISDRNFFIRAVRSSVTMPASPSTHDADRRACRAALSAARLAVGRSEPSSAQ